MKKIVITGGLGYIGSELCKIYSGESWNSKITVIDNRFISNQVHQLENEYKLCTFRYSELRVSKEYLKEADIVHHLAGITDVARTKDEQNEEKDKELNDVAEKALLLFYLKPLKIVKLYFHQPM